MSVIKFDSMGNLAEPTLVLATKSGRKLGKILGRDIVLKNNLNSHSEISFSVDKYSNEIECRLWDEISDFKSVYCPEWDLWFEIKVETKDSYDVVKNVSGTTICEAELSQIMLYNIEINTETDISRDDYVEPTILFNEKDPSSSLLNRITEKLPHYTIEHVDSSIAKVQRTFTFDGTSIYDAFQDISQEIGCLFRFGSHTDESGLPSRTIEVYDLMNVCEACGHREENMTVCTECGATDINDGFGAETGVFVSTESLADDITYTVDADSVKNCFKVEGGDDMIDATIRNCNPNGTDYIWHISETSKKDMSDELVKKINSYDILYNEYYKDKEIVLNSTSVSKYNSLVTKYKSVYDKQRDGDLQKVTNPIKGYSALSNVYYDVIDLSAYLQSDMMPSAATSGTTAQEQAALLTTENLSPVAVTSKTLTKSIIENAVLGLAKVYVKSSYMVKIKNSSFNGSKTWTGNFTVTNLDDDEDTCESATINVYVNNDIGKYVEQKMRKALDNVGTDDLSIVGLFDMSGLEFNAELKKYSLDSLLIFSNACQGCLDILIEEGYAVRGAQETYSIYSNYYTKSKSIQEEVAIRENEVNIIDGIYDSYGFVDTYGLKNYIMDERDKIQDLLNFEKYLGADLWKEFSAYRREDKYSNSNYISDGLNNAELFQKAKELFDVANKEIYKSSELQHHISASLKNILALKEFNNLFCNFDVGNWIRIKTDDMVFKLRLISYEINYSDLSNGSVEFSDVLKIATGMSDIQSVVQQASSMASSYSGVVRQASQGANSNKVVSNWVNKGLELTNSYISNSKNQELKLDSNGFLMREWLPITEEYDGVQLKIINKGLYMTDDNWETAKAAIGNFIYYDPKDKTNKSAHGVIADTLVGSLILGEEVGIYSTANNITLNNEGLTIKNFADRPTGGINANEINISANKNDSILSITTDTTKRFALDNSGSIYMDGDIHFTRSGDDTLIFNEHGQQFYGEDTNGNSVLIGNIGKSTWVNTMNDTTILGLSFNLEEDSGWMSWSVYDSDKSYYDTKLAYYNSKNMKDDNNNYLEQGLYLSAPTYITQRTYLYHNLFIGGTNTCLTYFYDTLDTSKFLGVGFNLKDDFIFSNANNEKSVCDIEINGRGSAVNLYSILDMHSNEIVNSSDSRLKTNIKDADFSALELIDKLSVKSFDWIESGQSVSAGTIAQQVEKYIPEIINTNEKTGIKGINYVGLIPYLIKAIQELSDVVCPQVNTCAETVGDNDVDWVDGLTYEEKLLFLDKVGNGKNVPPSEPIINLPKIYVDKDDRNE